MSAPGTPPSNLGPSCPAGGEPSASRCGETCARHDARTWWAVAGVGAALILVVGTLMLAGLPFRSTDEPWISGALAEAQAALRTEPKSAARKEAVRDLDLALRAAYFRRLDRNRLGAWVLLIGGGLAVAAALQASSADIRRTPWARDALESREAGARPRRRAIVLAGMILVGAGAVVALQGWGRAIRDEAPEVRRASVGRPATALPARTHTGATVAPPSAADRARTWPRFRGHEGAGLAVGFALPPRWNLKTRENVPWRVDLPLPGYNSPVVWEDRVFLTGGSKHQRLVFAIDAGTGAILWQRPLTPAGQTASTVEPPDQSGMAASTVTTDGTRVYAVFASGELGALDFQGALTWSRKVDFSHNGYGHASSLVIQDGLLLVQSDQGQADEAKSELLALNASTGAVRWRVSRPVGGSWATPLVAGEGTAAQVILAGDPLLMAYELSTGKELWRAAVLGGELAPSPVLAGDLVIASSPGHALLGVRWSNSADTATSRVVWKLASEVPDVPTPLVMEDLLITADTEGHVYCRESATGTKLWSAELELEIQASPIAVGDRVYLFAQSGTVVVLRASRTYEEVDRFETAEEIYATPAVAQGSLFLRTRQGLARIGGAALPGKEVVRAR